MIKMPETRGRLTADRPLADLTWLRVGGPAAWFFQPADPDDLAHFLRDLPPEMPVFPMGVGSNLIVRDGGLRAAVIRMGRGFNHIEIEDRRVRAGAAAYVADVFVEARAITRAGEIVTLTAADLNFRYRQTDLPEGMVLIEAVFEGPPGDPEALAQRMDEQLAKRDATQPTKDRTAGSTFRNPAGHSSTGRADDVHDLKAWKVIDDAGMRGARRGGAQMSEKHSNFLVNTGDATAADLEGLGEEVRKKVFQTSGIELEWEIMRVGEPARATEGEKPRK